MKEKVGGRRATEAIHCHLLAVVCASTRFYAVLDQEVLVVVCSYAFYGTGGVVSALVTKGE